MRIKLALLIVLLTAAAASVNNRAENLPLRKGDFVPGELIVMMQEGKKTRDLTLPDKAKASPKKHKGLEKLNAGVIQVPPGEESAYLKKLEKQKDVLAVEPNYLVHAEMTPNDLEYAQQYAPAAIQAESAWDVTTGTNSVTLAFIDSGIDATHPEFAGRIAAGYDFVEDDFIPQDECGHGTHVAGIAAATGNNNQGIAGIAWGVNLMPLRVLDETCSGSFADIADAFVYAADHGAQVINISVGSYSSSTLMENAAYYAYLHGAAIFAAAGNTGGTIAYPARYDSVMAVGSVDEFNFRAPSSSYGEDLDLMAPGVDIYSTLPMQDGFFYTNPCPNDGNPCEKSIEYDFISGTSMAAPHAAGAAALLLSVSSSCFDTPAKIYQALKDSALDLGDVGWDEWYGSGLVQIENAMNVCPAPTTFDVEYDLMRSDSCGALAPYQWVDATSSSYYLVENSGYQNFSLPFTFNFGGVDYASINVHSNGFISLGDNNVEVTDGNYQSNAELPFPSKPNNFIAPFWDDLTNIDGSAIVYVNTIGSAPNRQTVIEYRGMQRYNFPASKLNFEVILYEGSNEIKMQYRALTGASADGSSATVGLEYGTLSTTGQAGYPYSYNRGALKNGLALLFVPYSYGKPTLPSDNTCPQTKAVTVQPIDGFACETSPAQFDVDIAPESLPYQSALKVQQISAAPAMPAAYLDLKHYADIHFRYSPPAPTLYPTPEIYVCYEYTAQDLLTAGGHPENLFLAAHAEETKKWSALPTTVDAINSRLVALAPHFSYYGVATLNPQSASENELGLPTTGAPADVDVTFIIGLILWLGKLWGRKQ